MPADVGTGQLCCSRNVGSMPRPNLDDPNELQRIIYDEVKADVECEADAENSFQEGYAVGFNDARARILKALTIG